MGFVEIIQGFPAGWVYLFITLLMGFGAPEDLIILAAGYLAGIGVLDWLPLYAFVMLGLITGDVMVYAIGHTGSPLVKKWLTPPRYARVRALLHRHGEHATFFARFIPGLRFWFQLAAGVSRMRFRVFLFYDFIAGLVWAPIMLGIGYLFGGHMDAIVHAFKRAEIVITLAILAVILIYITRIERKEHAR